MSIQMKFPAKENAFTLIELLVTIGIIAFLVTLIAPGLIASKEQGRRGVCRNNLKQLILASLAYADEDRRGSFSDSRRDGNDDFNYLYSDKITPLAIFTCPSTRNSIRASLFSQDVVTGRRELSDLSGYARNTTAFGTSYELFGFMNAAPGKGGGIFSTSEIPVGETNEVVKGLRKTEGNVSSYRHQNAAFGIAGEIPGPSRIWLFVDGDETGLQNYPDKGNNHGGSGGNVSFCDGHVEFVRRKTYVRSYEVSQDENRTDP